MVDSFEFREAASQRLIAPFSLVNHSLRSLVNRRKAAG